MALIDDLRYIATLQEKEVKARHVASAFWIFERNPFLPEEEVAQGLAFMVEDYLQETDLQVRKKYIEKLVLLLESRQELGTAIDWQALVQCLPEVSPYEEVSIIRMLGSASDVKYLDVLERYVHIAATSKAAIASWKFLAFRVLYQRDWEVAPFLWSLERERKQPSPHVLPRRLPYTPRTRAEAEQHYKEGLYYFPNYMRYWLEPLGPDNPLKEKATLDHVFEYDMTLPIDEIALAIKIHVDYAFAHEEILRRSSFWSGLVSYPFHYRSYVGTYLDWETLLPRIEQLRELYPEMRSNPLPDGIALYGYANNERALSQLESYLEHPWPSIRLTAAHATVFLLFQLCHYCPFLSLLYAETARTLFILRDGYLSAPAYPPGWQQEMQKLVENFRASTRPYLHYYSI